MFENWLASFIDRDRPPGAMSFMDNKGVMGEWQRSERALLYNRLEAAFAALQLPWGEQEGRQRQHGHGHQPHSSEDLEITWEEPPF